LNCGLLHVRGSGGTPWSVRSDRNAVHEHIIHPFWVCIENILGKKFQSLGGCRGRESQRNFRPGCRTLLIGTSGGNYGLISKSYLPSSLISVLRTPIRIRSASLVKLDSIFKSDSKSFNRCVKGLFPKSGCASSCRSTYKNSAVRTFRNIHLATDVRSKKGICTLDAIEPSTTGNVTVQSRRSRGACNASKGFERSINRKFI